MDQIEVADARSGAIQIIPRKPMKLQAVPGKLKQKAQHGEVLPKQYAYAAHAHYVLHSVALDSTAPTSNSRPSTLRSRISTNLTEKSRKPQPKAGGPD